MLRRVTSVLRRVATMLVILSGASACTDPACRGLRGSMYRTVDAVGSRGCEDLSACGQHLRLEFREDGRYHLDLDDTDRGGPYTCEDGKIDLDSEVFSAELSGDRLILRGPGGATEYERAN